MIEAGCLFSFYWDDDISCPVLTDVINWKLCKIYKLLIQDYRSSDIIFVTSANSRIVVALSSSFKKSKSCLGKRCKVRYGPDAQILLVFNEFDMTLLCYPSSFVICLPHFSNILLFCRPSLFLHFNQTDILVILETCCASFLRSLLLFFSFWEHTPPPTYPPGICLANYPASLKLWLQSHIVNKAQPDDPL